MVGLEHLLAQGVSAGEPLHIEDHYPALKNKRERDIKFVAGNAMHPNVLGLLMQYVICQADWKQGQRVGGGALLFACMFTSFCVCQFVCAVNRYLQGQLPR